MLFHMALKNQKSISDSFLAKKTWTIYKWVKWLKSSHFETFELNTLSDRVFVGFQKIRKSLKSDHLKTSYGQSKLCECNVYMHTYIEDHHVQEH